LLDSEEFTQRQLSDTRYLSRVAADYLATLYGGRTDDTNKQRVFATPGSVTKYLRDSWDLNRLLHVYGDPDDPQQKNRADHRHHAIDALLVALSTPKIVADLNRAASQAEKLGTRHLFVELEPPWPDFSAADVEEVIQSIVVSSRVNRKLNGALHKETIVSKPKTIIDAKTGKPKTVHHVRKPLEKMSRGEVDDIVDNAVKAAVIAKLERLGGEPGKVFADPGNHPHLSAKNGRLIPIHSARIRVADSTVAIARDSRRRYVAPGSNHPMIVMALLDGVGNEVRWEGLVLPRIDAVIRNSQGMGVVSIPSDQSKRFKFTLAPSEHLLLEPGTPNERVVRIGSISQEKQRGRDGQKIEFVVHNDARPSTVIRKASRAGLSVSPDGLRKLHAAKVTIDPLGMARLAND